MIFDRATYDALHAVVFRADYPGFKPNVIEAPNGDGRLDAHKRYAHVATKYLNAWAPTSRVERAMWELMLAAFQQAFTHAEDLARRLGVPDRYRPSVDACALRVLDYGPGAGSEIHTDVSMFTVMCYRDQPDKFRVHADDHPDAVRAHAADAQLHFGRLGLQTGITSRALAHWVEPSETTQRSIVFFALPSHDAVLPSGEGVGAFVTREMAKMRYDRTEVPAPPPQDDADAWYAAELARLRERAPA